MAEAKRYVLVGHNVGFVLLGCDGFYGQGGASPGVHFECHRTEICNQPQPLRANMKYEAQCGRPLGLRFNKQTGDLFIADSYFGLLKVGPEGGVAELLSSEGDDGHKYSFTNDLDIDHDGTVYFTDSSSKYPRKYVTPS